MIPIVFWASFEPWLNAMYVAEHDLEPPEAVVEPVRMGAAERSSR